MDHPVDATPTRVETSSLDVSCHNSDDDNVVQQSVDEDKANKDETGNSSQ